MFKSIVKILSAALISILSTCSVSSVKVLDNPHKSAGMLTGTELGTSVKPGFTANVMAPLHVDNMGEFEGWLSTAQSMGVDAVSVDVWWGDVEKIDNKFDWSYYDIIFEKIKSRHLKIVPIMSFHQCGGNVGDVYSSILPSWIWTKGTDMKYKSEQGNYCPEYVSLWADTVAKQEYIDFMNDFERHFSSYSNVFQELNVSCGPAGELRYPSYNSHDKESGYPTRGAFQGYSDRAKNDFRNWVKAKYKTVEAVQASWKSDPPITTWDSVNVPGKPSGSQMDDFWYFSAEKTPYGKDLFTWYNNALAQHGKRIMQYAISAFDSSMADISLGFKISGIHWRISDKDHPRAAELNGGLIPGYDSYNESNGYGYDYIVSIPKSFTRKINLHFTCLEMDDNDYEDGKYVASKAKTLVFWVGKEALRQGVTIKGENALSGGITNDHGWDNIFNATTYSSYNGLTALRISDVINKTGKFRYGQYIQEFKGSSLPSLCLRGTFNSWGTTSMIKNGDVWSASGIQFGNTPSECFKFDVFGDWSKNYGGSGLDGNAIQSGNNIAVPAGKKCNVTFNDKTFYYKVDVVNN